MAIRRQVHAGHPHSLGVPLLGSIKVDTQTCGIKWKPPFDRRDIRGNRLSDAVVRLVVRFGDNQVSAGGGDGRPVPGRRPCGIYVPGRPSGRHLVRRRHVRGPDDAQLRRQSDRAQGGARHTDRVRRTARPPEAVRGVTVRPGCGRCPLHRRRTQPCVHPCRTRSRGRHAVSRRTEHRRGSDRGSPRPVAKSPD